MIIDNIVILKLYLIDNRGGRIRYPCSNTDSVRRTPCVIIRTHYITRAGHDTQKMYNRYNYNYTLFSYNRYNYNYFKKIIVDTITNTECS